MLVKTYILPISIKQYCQIKAQSKRYDDKLLFSIIGLFQKHCLFGFTMLHRDMQVIKFNHIKRQMKYEATWYE